MGPKWGPSGADRTQLGPMLAPWTLLSGISTRFCFNSSIIYRKGFLYEKEMVLIHFSNHWTFVQGIHQSPVNSPHKGQWHGALMFSLNCAWINSWVNLDLRCHHTHYDAHYDITALWCQCQDGILPGKEFPLSMRETNTGRLANLNKYWVRQVKNWSGQVEFYI